MDAGVSVRLKLFLLCAGLIFASSVAAASYVQSVDARFVASACAFALAASGAVSALAALWVSTGVSQLTATARRMTAGDLDVRTHKRGGDEIGQLGSSLDQLADSLSGTLRELRAERDLHANILDGMAEGVLVLDREGRVVVINRALREMLLVGSNALGRPLIEVVRHAALSELMTKAAVDRANAARAEIGLPGVKPRRLLAYATALAGPDQRVVAVFADVTELRRLESLRRDFVANVSHELRTPVTAVRSAAETLLSSALSDPDPSIAIRFVEMVERNAGRLQSLIDDLLDLSRLDSNQFRLRIDPIDLGVLANTGMAVSRERAASKGVRLTAEIGPERQTFQGDARALEQVLSNLLDNAVKYCPSGATVTLTTALHDGALQLAVSDNGPGIDDKHIPRLFERFYRVDAGRSREVGGTGLGLSIVKHLVEAMGGTIAVDSKLGQGTTFRAALPSRVPPPFPSSSEIDP